jgi:predicted DsbA family dithiol-disulfide isomerase
MLVEIWSDVVCPWCFIGKRRFEEARREFAHGDDVEVVWRAFELDPNAPARREGDPAVRIARKYGLTLDQAVAANDRLTRLAAREGLDYHLDQAVGGNTFNAHRVVHHAHTEGLADAMHERLLQAHLVEGQPVGERATLVALAAEVGLDADRVGEVLDSGAFAPDVRADEQRAVELEVTGVPFFLFDGQIGLPGAQDVELMSRVLERAWDRRS